MNTKMRNKIKGAVYGFAIGDAMGATTEFLNEYEIKRVYGKVTEILGGGWLFLQPGEVTDDTQMTMCIMSTIMRKPKNEKEFEKFCKEHFIVWYNSNPKDIGGQCQRAIQCMCYNIPVPADKNVLGNGSLMRAMPLAILNLPMLNILQGRLTHNNYICSKVIKEYTLLMQAFLNDDSEASKGVIDIYKHYKYSNLLEPTGHVYNTFNNSIFWSNKKSFEEALFGAVNHGGDADTIAAITGSLAGAKFGFDSINNNWVNTLNPDVKEFLDKFIEFVFDCLQI